MEEKKKQEPEPHVRALAEILKKPAPSPEKKPAEKLTP